MGLFGGKEEKVQLWEEIEKSLGSRSARAKVPGGWLVKTAWGGEGVGLTFMPDPEHSWDGKALPTDNL